MSKEPSEQGWENEENTERRRSHSSRHYREKKQSLEEQVLNVANNDLEKARELVMIRKELLRLHYKVKNYHSQARLTNSIAQLVIIILLLVILFRLYTI